MPSSAIEPTHPLQSRPARTAVRLNLEDVLLFTLQLEILLKCGIPLHRSLQAIVIQAEPKLSELVCQLILDIERGFKFSFALEQHPKSFSESYVRAIEAAEASGQLVKTLGRLRRFLDKQSQTRRLIKSALIYPTFLLSGCSALLLVMLYFIFPMVVSVTQNAGVEPPILTRGLMVLTSPACLLATSLCLLVSALLLGVVLSHPSSRDRVRIWLECYTPLGRFWLRLQVLESIRQFGLLLDSGIDLLNSLQYAATLANSSVILREAYQSILSELRMGVVISEAFSKHKVFPPMLVGVLAVSAEVGGMPKALARFCDALEEDLSLQLRSVLSALEPMLLTFMGAVVGLLLVAAFLPLYELIKL